jgi:hypothetical protein
VLGLLTAGVPQLAESFRGQFIATLGGGFQQNARLSTVPFDTCAGSVTVRERYLRDRVAIFHRLPKRSYVARKATRLAGDNFFSACSQFGLRGGLSARRRGLR